MRFLLTFLKSADWIENQAQEIEQLKAKLEEMEASSNTASSTSENDRITKLESELAEIKALLGVEAKKEK